MTSSDSPAWWQVDLGAPVRVSTVVVTSTGTPPFVLYVGNVASSIAGAVACSGSVQTTSDAPTLSLATADVCGAVVGRYVMLVAATGPLSLCEVEVY